MAFQNVFSFLSGLLRPWSEANADATGCCSNRPVCPHALPASLNVREERPPKCAKISALGSGNPTSWNQRVNMGATDTFQLLQCVLGAPSSAFQLRAM